jgi:hypothetical protein
MKIESLTLNKTIRLSAIMSRKEVVSADLAEAKAAMDAANQQISGTLEDGIALAADIYAEVKQAITAAGVDTSGSIPADYADDIALIPGAVEAAFKGDLDAANEEPSADLGAGIALVSGNYAAIKAKIAAKGVDMAGVKPSGYDEKIAVIGDTYTRPSFWPELPNIAVDENGEPTEQVLHLLIALYPDRVNRLNFLTQATWTLDFFGEMPTQNLISGVNRIFLNASDFSAPVIESVGYKVVKATLRPSSGVIGYLNTQDTTPAWDRILFIKAAFSATNNAEISIRFLHMLREIEVVGAPRIRGYGSLGNQCRLLQKITFNPKRVTTSDAFFLQEATSECVLAVPNNTLDFSAGNNLTGTLQQCRFSLAPIKVICPNAAAFSAENMIRNSWIADLELVGSERINNTTSMFLGAAYLAKLKIPGIKISFSIASTSISFGELKRLIENDLGTPATTATLTITSTPDAAEIMAAITAGTITVPAGWTVTN